MQGEYAMGIDPGKQGAIALLRADDMNGSSLEIFDMPLVTTASGKKEVCAKRLAELLDRYRDDIHTCFIEKVAAMTYFDRNNKQVRGQGAAASFQFGKGYGILLGILAAYEIPTTEVYPSVWKLSMRLGRDKTASRLRAQELFPKAAAKFLRAKDDGRAEAALLAFIASVNA